MFRKTLREVSSSCSVFRSYLRRRREPKEDNQGSHQSGHGHPARSELSPSAEGLLPRFNFSFHQFHQSFHQHCFLKLYFYGHCFH